MVQQGLHEPQVMFAGSARRRTAFSSNAVVSEESRHEFVRVVCAKHGQFPIGSSFEDGHEVGKDRRRKCRHLRPHHHRLLALRVDKKRRPDVAVNYPAKTHERL